MLASTHHNFVRLNWTNDRVLNIALMSLVKVPIKRTLKSVYTYVCQDEGGPFFLVLHLHFLKMGRT